MQPLLALSLVDSLRLLWAEYRWGMVWLTIAVVAVIVVIIASLTAPRGMLRLSAGVDAVGKFFGVIGEYLVLACCLISAGNAMSRYLFSVSSNGWLEIQWYMFGFIVLMGAAYTLKNNEHVRVDLIYGSVSDRARLWIDTIGIILFLLPFSLYAAWLSWPIFRLSLGVAPWSGLSGLWQLLLQGEFATIGRGLKSVFLNGEMSSNAGGLIRWPIKLVISAGFGLLALQGIAELIKRVTALNGSIHLETAYEKPLQ